MENELLTILLAYILYFMKMSCYSTIIKMIEFIVNEKQNVLEWKKYKFKRLLSDIICI